MSQDPKHSRKLREMFRVFQRQKREKCSDEEFDEKTDAGSTGNRKMASSGSNYIAEGKSRKKKQANWTTEQPTLTSVDEQETPQPQVKSASEMKRLNIRLKYGIHEKDQEFYRKAKNEDNEEFENVNAVARPAATKMRRAKLKWKNQEAKEQESSGRGVQKSASDASEDVLDEVIENESREDSRIADIKRRNHESLTELRILIIRIEELELANRKLTLQMKRVKKQLSEKEKSQKVEELTSLVTFLQKSGSEEQEEKPTSQQEAIAIRGLEIMKRNQLLEHGVRSTERVMLCNFFEGLEPKPTQAIVMTIDKALSYAIEVLLMRPDKFDDFVDNELRIFLLDTQKAKRILLDVMLLHPEYVPRTWGGDVMAKRQREGRQAAIEKEKRQNVAESKSPSEGTKTLESIASSSIVDDDVDLKVKERLKAVKKIRIKGSTTPADVMNAPKKGVSDEKTGKDIKTVDNKNISTTTEKKNETVLVKNVTKTSLDKTIDESKEKPRQNPVKPIAKAVTEPSAIQQKLGMVHIPRNIQITTPRTTSDPNVSPFNYCNQIRRMDLQN